MPANIRIQSRRDTAANWTSANPVLANGEYGIETDTNMVKIGNGSTAWNSLEYYLAPLVDELLPVDTTGAYFTGSGFQIAGVSNTNFCTSPDSAALDITGDIDIRVKLSMADWTPSQEYGLFGKYTLTGDQRSYAFTVRSGGKLAYRWSTNGASGTGGLSESSVINTIADGATKWIRVTHDVDNGATQNEVKFWTSDDGTNWTQLGTTITNAGVTSIFSGTAILQIGQLALVADSQASTIYRAQVLNGIGGTTVFDANFETVPADSFAFTESSANAATVTLTTTRYSFGLPGTTLIGTFIGGNTQARLNYYPIKVPSKPITLRHCAFEVTTAPSGTATVNIALYASDSQLQPTGSPLFNTTFTVTSTGVGLYRIRLTPRVLPAGHYIIGLYHSLGLNWRGYSNSSTTHIHNTLGATANLSTRFASGTVMTDPATKWTSFSGSSGAGNAVILGWS